MGETWEKYHIWLSQEFACEQHCREDGLYGHEVWTSAAVLMFLVAIVERSIFSLEHLLVITLKYILKIGFCHLTQRIAVSALFLHYLPLSQHTTTVRIWNQRPRLCSWALLRIRGTLKSHENTVHRRCWSLFLKSLAVKMQCKWFK